MTAPWEVLVALAPAWPPIGALLIFALHLRPDGPSERAVVRVATASLALSLLSVLAAGARWSAGGMRPLQIHLGDWYRAGEYGFRLTFLVDGVSVPFALLSAVLLLATCRFSSNYLHREPGFTRFFVLTLVFAAGAQLMALGGSLDLLFAGWELVGLTSVLLVAFFHERAGPTRAAIRVFVTYRLCDIGLPLAAVMLHQARHSSVFLDVFKPAAHHGGLPALPLALALLLSAMGKSAQFPVGGWLPRAMEGPTPSSAVFYGGLSAHAGVFLLVRTAPLYAHSWGGRCAIVAVGATTAVMASLSGQVSPDAKSGLAYATVSQVGLMFVACGLGFPRLALAHLCAHMLLRYYQFLRTPSALQDALQRRAALGATEADDTAARWEVLGVRLRRFLYRLAIERFEVEAALDRWVVQPALALSQRLDAADRRLMGDVPTTASARPTRLDAVAGPEARGSARRDEVRP